MRYYIIAGEASGDLHGSNLVKGLRSQDPEAQIRCHGGDLMAAAGAELVRHYKESDVMGITDVVASAGKISRKLKDCKKDILEWKPDVVILIDYPGFNMKIAKFCHEKGIRVFYYIAPKTWASREKRNEKLRRYVDKLFIVFPFEQEYFRKAEIPFVYKGNPLIDAVDGHKYINNLGCKYIALLPGSRKGEISRMMPVCMEVADRLGCNIVIAGAPSRTLADYAPYIGARKNVSIMFNNTYDVLKFAEAAIINSGTASLEAALIGTPQVVCWSTSPLTAFVGRKIFKVMDHVKYISLGNLIIDRPAFRELVQEEFNAANVEAEVRRLTGDEAYRAKMLSDYADIRAALGGAGASEAIAKAMMEELKNQR